MIHCPTRLTRLAAALLCLPAVLAACGDDDPVVDLNQLPTGFGAVATTSYDGTTDDLLTAGLGKTGIAGAAPGFVDATSPTAAELRRRAIYTNYRALVDFSAAGGYGTLYGPNVTSAGVVTTGEGKVAGREFIAFADDGTGRKNVGMMVQLPATFDPNNPCIITAPSSGSRGIYGAIGTSGEWGLKRGCAVAYTDAGKGIGYHDLQADKVNLIDGRLVARGTASANAHFAADLGSTTLAQFNAATPNRFAYKHAHSQQNPEKDWGRNVLDSIRFALWAINEVHAPVDAASGRHTRAYKATNVLVIASSVSNGGGESLQAAEQDTEGLIDAVAVSEPNAQPNSMAGVTVTEGSTLVANAGKPLGDYFTYRMLFEPCAAISASAQAPTGVRPGWLGVGTAPSGTFNQVAGVELQTIATNRCASLAAKGLITGATTAQQADAALAKLQAYGWTDPNHNALHASHYRLADIYVALSYVIAYGRFSVADNLCGFSLANVDATGSVAAQAATQALLFATGNGLNTGGDVVYNDSVGGARLYHVGVSPSSNTVDGSLDGLLCLHNLVTGANIATGLPLTGTSLANSQRVRTGLQDVLLGGNLRGKPTVVVAGRSDTLLPPNHTARAYAAFHSKVEPGSEFRYYEITNGQHFDGFNPAVGGVAGFDTLFVPVHHYMNKALDLVWARMKAQTPLPPSQVVRTVPRGGTPGAAPAITSANVPDIAANPAAGDAITIGSGAITVPN